MCISPCKSPAKLCAKLSIWHFYTIFTHFPTFSHRFLASFSTTPPPLTPLKVFHYSTAPTTTTTNIFNKERITI